MEVDDHKELEQLKHSLQACESALKKSDSLSTWLDKLEDGIKEFIQPDEDDEPWSDTKKAFFLRTTIPRVVIILLKRGDLDDDDASRVHDFFINVVDLILDCIRHDVPELMDTLCKLFDSSEFEFYMKYGRDDSEDYNMYTDDQDMHSRSEYETNTSMFYSSIVKRFANSGGFNNMLQRLKDTESRPPLIIVKYFCKAICKVKEFFEEEVIERQLNDMHPTVFELVYSLTDEEMKNEDKKVISAIAKYMEGIMKYVEPNMTSEQLDIFNLNVALKCFKSPYLEKRLAGLNDIKEMISFVLRKAEWAYNSKLRGNTMGGHHNLANSWIDTEKLSSWLQQHRILELLYGENMHPELIRRCSEVPRFLAYEGLLDHAALNLIWEASEGKHESITHIIYQSISDIVNQLSLEDIDYFFQKINAIPLPSYSFQTLSLVKSFTVAAMNRMVSNNSLKLDARYGLDNMWRLIQDEAGVSDDLAEQSLQGLQEFLKWPNCNCFRMHFITASMGNLQKHTSVPMSLKLLLRIFDTFPAKRARKGEPTCREAVEHVNSECHLLEFFFEDLSHYKTAAREAASQLPAATNVNDSVLVGKYPHLNQVYDRLYFLEYVLSAAGGSVTPQQIDTFWKNLVVDALSPEERDQSLKWLNESRSLHSAEEGARHLFINRFPELEFSGLSKTGLTLFETLFTVTNYRDHKYEQSEKGAVLVKSFDLLGLDLLWKIVFSVQDPLVGKNSIHFLNKIYKNLAPAIRNQLGAKREEFITKCMNQLSVACNDDKPDELKINRSLALLKSILEESEVHRSTARPRHGASSGGRPITVVISVFQAANSKFNLQISSNETVGVLRQKVAESQNCHPSLIRLIAAGKEIKHDYETLEDARIHNGNQVNAMKRTLKPDEEAARADAEEEDESAYPSTILSTQKYFQQLFTMLTVNEEVGQKVWDLLMMLPTNRQMLDVLRNLSPDERGAVPWDDLLDSRSTFKLLYALQIVDSFLRTSQSEVDTQWRAAFISKNGVKHLINILMTKDFYAPVNGSKRKTCLSLLLKIIKFFVSDGFAQLRVNLIQDCVQPVALMRRLIETVWSASGHSNSAAGTGTAVAPEPEDGEVVKSAMAILVAGALSQHELLEGILGYPSFPNWLAAIVLYTPEENIRAEACVALYDLCRLISDTSKLKVSPHDFILDHLLRLLPQVDAHATTCEQYFDFLNKLLADSCDKAVAAGRTADFGALLQQVIIMIIKRPIVEDRNGIEPDKVLVGLMLICCTLLNKLPAFKEISGAPSHGNLVYQLFNCLFEIPTAENHGNLAPPKCKTRYSRHHAFQLLLELSKNCEPNFRQLVEYLIQHHKPEERRAQWHYLPSGYEKAACGYVGMKNLGATCYMNSLMQQLFMIPAFRYALLAVEDKETDTANSLLYQLQYIFGSLQESEKKYYDTKDFCNAYKPDGQPANPSVQMDVDEFFNMLFDKLENLLKGTKRERLLQEFFGGTITNQIISKGCPHVSEREEGFFTLSLEVKNKKNITESLELYVEGDMLEGDNKYFCGTCSNKVDALKRCCIKTLPNTLIIHAKRFEFDIESMRRMKLNESFEFPTRLNMEPYTKEGLARIEAANAAKENGQAAPALEAVHPASYYEYELSGVLVHTGTADSGHYYSFIKERHSKHGGDKRWFQFNDTQVEPFSIEEIPKACYGGVDMVQQWDTVQGKHVTRMHPRVNNAYMLFYDRVKQEDLPLSTSEASKIVPGAIFSQIWEENMKFLRDKNIFDTDYFGFLWRLVQQGSADSVSSDSTEPNQEVMLSIELGTRFVVETLSHAKEKASLKDCATYLKVLYSKYPQGCRWMLQTLLVDLSWIRQMLFTCTIPEAREIFAGLLNHVIACLMPEERPLYFDRVTIEDSNQMEITSSGDKLTPAKQKAVHQAIESDGSEYQQSRSKSLVIQFMDEYIDLLKEAHQYWRHFAQYFLVLRDFAMCGPEERKYLISRNIVGRLIDFYLGEESPNAKLRNPQKKTKMGDKFSSPNVSYMVELISVMVRGCETRTTAGIPPTRLPGDILQFDSADTDMLYTQAFYAKVIKENVNVRATTEIVLHLCWEDNHASRKVIETLTSAINDVDFDAFKPYFEVLEALLNMNDSQQDDRVDQALRRLVKVIDKYMKYKNATLYAIKFLADVAPTIAPVRQWLQDHMDDWVEGWLMGSNHDVVREVTLALIMGLVPVLPMTQFISFALPMPTPAVPQGSIGPAPVLPTVMYMPPRATYQISNAPIALDAESKANLHEVFQHLLSLITRARQYGRGDTDAKAAEDYMKSFWRLSAYARALEWCVISDEERSIFTEHHQDFASLVIHIDQFHLECDENKQELVKFWAHCLEGPHIENIKYIVDTEKIVTKLCDYFVSIRPSERFKQYNNLSLPAFYRIIYLCCEFDTFLERIMTHRNFEWAVKFLYLENPDYPQVADALFDIMLRCAHHSPEYRTRQIGTVLGQDKFQTNTENIVRLLQNLLISAEDRETFAERNGLNILTRFIEHRVERDVESTDDAIRLIPALELLIMATDWMQHELLYPDKSKGENVSLNSWEMRSTLARTLPHLLDIAPLDERLSARVVALLKTLTHLDGNNCTYQVLQTLYETFYRRREQSISRFASHASSDLMEDESNQPEKLYFNFAASTIMAVLKDNRPTQIPLAVEFAILLLRETLLVPRDHVFAGSLVVMQQILANSEWAAHLATKCLEHLVHTTLLNHLITRHINLNPMVHALFTQIFPIYIKYAQPQTLEEILRRTVDQVQYQTNTITQMPTHAEGWFLAVMAELKALAVFVADDNAREIIQQDPRFVNETLPTLVNLATKDEAIKGLHMTEDLVQLVHILSKP